MNTEIKNREQAKIQEKAAAVATNLEAIRNIGFTVPEYCLIAEALLHIGINIPRRVCRIWYLIEAVAGMIHHSNAEHRWGINSPDFLDKINKLTQEQAETLIKAMRGFWKINRSSVMWGSTDDNKLVVDAHQSLIKVGLLPTDDW
ncbi:MAG: hypothetical protein OXI43_05620 [Candidatus Poribacteria bacterium]|nr:hypothetical protein [Candidatus Poribacteria bacterium]